MQYKSDNEFINTFVGNYATMMPTDLAQLIDTWGITCPVDGDKAYKLYIQIDIDHPSGSNPFYIFEKKSMPVLPNGTENCEIIYGTNMKKSDDNIDYMVSMTSHSNCKMAWFNFFITCIENKTSFIIKEIEAGKGFVRVVLS